MPFEELKARHSVVWGTGPYERVSATIADLQDELIARLGPAPGVRWLDSATGTGETAKRAARAGADVVGVDIAPALIETARREAEEDGLEIRYEVCDCEALPFEDASFDVVSSTCGVMFAPDHAAVAGELTRVTSTRRANRARLLDARQHAGRDLPHPGGLRTCAAAPGCRLALRLGQ